jgi:tetratricopeptide (TPR) repeat protein
MKYYAAAVSYHKKKDFKDAITYYNAAIKKDRKFWQSWLGLGICYYSMAKYRNAKLIFQYVLSIKPGEPTATKYNDIMSPKKNSMISAAPEGARNKADLMWRSALLPGFGQFYNGELAKGYIYSIAYIASVTAIVKYAIDGQNAISAYNNTNYDFAAKYKSAQDIQGKIVIPIAAAAAVWSISVLDAFLSGKDEKPKNLKRTVEIKYDNGITVAYNFAQVSF